MKMDEQEIMRKLKPPLNEVSIGDVVKVEGWDAEVIGIIKCRENNLYIFKNCEDNAVKVAIYIGIGSIPIKGTEKFLVIKRFDNKDTYDNLSRFIKVFLT